MTKRELLAVLKNVADDAEVRVACDTKSLSHNEYDFDSFALNADGAVVLHRGDKVRHRQEGFCGLGFRAL